MLWNIKGKPVHTGLYLVRKGMRLDGATLSLFIAHTEARRWTIISVFECHENLEM
jgi:hypothetical protein